MKKLFLTLFFSVLLISFLFPKVALAKDVLIDCPNGGKGIDSAIGCVPITGSGGAADSTAFLGFILKWAIGVGGGIAFLLILYSGFQIMTSAGDPQRLKTGQELLTAAISGLILLIFSVFILQVIGVTILNIPGLSI